MFISNENCLFETDLKHCLNEKRVSLIWGAPSFDLVGSGVIFSHRFLEDLEKIWALREYIPNPTNHTFNRFTSLGL